MIEENIVKGNLIEINQYYFYFQNFIFYLIVDHVHAHFHLVVVVVHQHIHQYVEVSQDHDPIQDQITRYVRKKFLTKKKYKTSPKYFNNCINSF